MNSLPRSGKDTVANMIRDKVELRGKKVQLLSFKEKLIELSARFVHESVDEFMIGYDSKTEDMLLYDLYPDKTYPEWWKDFPMYHINGKEMSKREVLIHVSEKVIKPTLGQDFFGKNLADRIEQDSDVIAISDGGFVDELLPVIDKGDVVLVRIVKDDLTEVEDSRKLLTPMDFYDRTGDIVRLSHLDNNSSLKDLNDEVDKMLSLYEVI